MNQEMKNSSIVAFIIIFTCLFLPAIIVNAQLAFDINAEKFAEKEKQAFRVVPAGGITGAAASFVTTASNNFDIHFYRCEWQIDPAVRFINGKVTSFFSITSSTDKIVFDLSDTLTVDSVIYNTNQISFQRITNDGLQIQFPAVLDNGRQDSVSVYYHGVPRSAASGSFSQSSHNGVPIIWTLSEPYGSKEWWPCKNGLDDKADSIDIIISNPDVYQASSNGVMVQEIDTAGIKTSVWKHRYPIASYLVALAVTKYIVLKDTTVIGGKTMDLIDYSFPEYKDAFNVQRYLTKNALNIYAELFEDYPFAKEKYGYTQFGAGGGMEHQTNSYVGSPDFSLITHETGHQWFGDKITCGSWQDIWLNEGFATYCQVLYNERTNKGEFHLNLIGIGNAVTALPGGSVWVDDTSNAGRIFSTRLTYYKGSYLLHMLRWKLGDTAFFKGIKRYLKDPLLKYNYARTTDLQRNLEQESGKDLSGFFQKWFNLQGYPSYAVTWVQDSNHLAFIKINQVTSHASVSFFDMPVPLEFKNANRDTIIVFNHIKNGQTFLADPGFKADTVIFDPSLWILSKNNTTVSAGCNSVTNNDNLFPHYNIKWTQNSNNWSYVEITQANTAPSTLAENIPLYLHFSGNGRDTSFLIKNIRYVYNTWWNLGFKATSVFITSSSCFMDNNYTITGASTSQAVNEIKIFPVPAANNTIYISLKNPSDKDLKVTLYNVAGQLVYEARLNTPGKDELFSLPVGHLSMGSYILRLQSESAIRMSKKIIR